MNTKPLPRAHLLAALSVSVSSCVADINTFSVDSGADATTPSVDGGVAPVGECDGKPAGSLERRVRYKETAVPEGQECMAQGQSRECGEDGQWTEWTGDYTAESCSVTGLASCGDLPHGTEQTRDRYEVASVPFGQECKKQSQTRSCADGTWTDWSGSYGEETCSVTGAASCEGTPHSEQQSRVRYASLTVPYGSTCVSEMQTRDCSDGTFSAWTGTLTQETCRVLDALSCGNSPHGTVEKRTRFETNLVTTGECKSEEQTRSCDQGTWSVWTGTFAEALCDVQGTRRCGDTLHGEQESRLWYQSAVVPFGAQCVSELRSRLCTDGTFGAWSGTYTAESCAPAAPASCDGTPHGGKRTRDRFTVATVPFGTLCVPEVQESTCNNGTWSDFTGTATIETCTVTAPANCDTGAHGDTQNRTRFAASSVVSPAACQQETQTRTCNNGVWTAFSGTYTAETCTVLPASCDGVPNGGTRTRTRFAAANAPFAGCVSEEQVSTCNNGTWGDFTGTYAAEQCTPALCVSTFVPAPPVASELATNAVILYSDRATNFRCSPNGQYQFGFGEASDLQLRDRMGVVVWSQVATKTAVPTTPAGSTEPVLITAYRMVMQADSNFLVRSQSSFYNTGSSGSTSSALWSSATNKPTGSPEQGAKLTVNDNGTITIVAPTGTVLKTYPPAP